MREEVENPMVVDSLWDDEPKPCGTDWQGNEVLEGDSIVVDPDTGEVIQEDDLEDYLIERLGFEFKTAK